MQTKLESLVEQLVNIFIGYSIAVASQLVIFPWFGIAIPITDNLLIGAYFTVISLVRGYIIRRWFNGFKNFKSFNIFKNSKSYNNIGE
jgi:hypothetical protein